jgi:hypothetical protein
MQIVNIQQKKHKIVVSWTKWAIITLIMPATPLNDAHQSGLFFYV